jgi:hypothetical protein
MWRIFAAWNEVIRKFIQRSKDPADRGVRATSLRPCAEFCIRFLHEAFCLDCHPSVLALQLQKSDRLAIELVHANFCKPSRHRAVAGTWPIKVPVVSTAVTANITCCGARENV